MSVSGWRQVGSFIIKYRRGNASSTRDPEEGMMAVPPAGGALADGVQAAGKLAGDAAQAVAQYVNDNPRVQEALTDMALDAVGAIVANKLKSK